MLAESRSRYRDRHPFYYLDAVACSAWLDKLSMGRYSDETRRELELFETLGAGGLRAIHVAQGFLD